jgi:hypothetical protein
MADLSSFVDRSTLTWLKMILRIRSIAEHYSVKNDHVLNRTRTTLPSLFEKMFIAPKNINYHLEHHLYPSVPFFRLPPAAYAPDEGRGIPIQGPPDLDLLGSSPRVCRQGMIFLPAGPRRTRASLMCNSTQAPTEEPNTIVWCQPPRGTLPRGARRPDDQAYSRTPPQECPSVGTGRPRGQETPHDSMGSIPPHLCPTRGVREREPHA